MTLRKPLSQLLHGAGYAYRRGCRCVSCRAWKAEDVALYRRRNQTKRKADIRVRKSRAKTRTI